MVLLEEYIPLGPKDASMEKSILGIERMLILLTLVVMASIEFLPKEALLREYSQS